MSDIQAQSQQGVMPLAHLAGAPKLTFGIYPGGALGTNAGVLSDKTNDPARIIDMIGRLQKNSKPFIVRCYLHYTDSQPDWTGRSSQPEDFLQCVSLLDSASASWTPVRSYTYWPPV